MFPKTGNKFPRAGRDYNGASPYAQLVATALRTSLDDTHRAIKTVMSWSGANERTVKNWLSGANGPHGDYLLILLGKSDAVVDALIGSLPPDRLTELAIRLIRRVGGDRHLLTPVDAGVPSVTTNSPIGSLGGSDRALGTNGPNPDTRNVTDPSHEQAGLNHRQLWFLRQLRAGQPARAADLRREHNVSERTAKRDIAALRRLNMITYVGSHRKGRYSTPR